MHVIAVRNRFKCLVHGMAIVQHHVVNQLPHDRVDSSQRLVQ